MPRSPDDRDGGETVSPDQAFALLANDTRVGILRALWDAFDSGRGDNALGYSEVFGRVDISDSGNFSYHLEKLTGPFVRRTDGGYELKQTGINVVRAVVTGTVTTDPSMPETEVDESCPRCGAPVAVAYRDEFLNVSCTRCDGRSRWNGEAGHVFGALVPPAGIDQHSVETAFRAAVAFSLHETSIFHEGICAHCLGPVETVVEACHDHRQPADGLCPNCQRFNLADAWMGCRTCKRSLPPPAALVLLDTAEARTFLRARGVGHRFTTWDTVDRSFGVEENLASAEPFRLEVTVPAGDDELDLRVDDELTVLDASH